MKFIVLVEGATEKEAVPAFLGRWLNPQLSERVGIKPVKHDGWAKMRSNAPTKAKLYGNDPDVIGVIGLLDLHGPNYPTDKLTVAARYDWLKQTLEREVGHPKFRQFAAVHELEAWILSQPSLLHPLVRDALPNSVSYPESVNSTEPPKKLLKRLYSAKLKKDYKETVDGPELFSKLDPASCGTKCPHLQKLMDEMLAMAKAAGL